MISINSAEQLGAALRHTRKHLQLTQAQLAQAAGVGLRFVIELEAGKPTVRLDKVFNVIHTLGGEFHLGGLNVMAVQRTDDT